MVIVRAVARLGILIVGGYALLCVIFFVRQREQIFPGQYTVVAPEPPKAFRMEAFRIPTSSGEVDAFYLPPFDTRTPFPALIFGHGNGDVIDHWIEGLDEFRRLGLGVMLVEYPGYGRSDGSPSEAAIREAMLGAYDRLASLPGVDPKMIIGYGQSLGGGAICTLAARRPLAALILHSTFTSLRPFASQFFMPSFLIRDPFDNAQTVRAFEGPVLVLHGRQDELIPLSHGEELARIARAGRLLTYECGHLCWEPERFPFVADITSFLREHTLTESPRSRITIR